MHWILDFFIGWFGVGAILCLVATAIAVFMPVWLSAIIPNLRAAAIVVAVIAGTASFVYAKGYFDGSSEIQQEWDDAKSEAVKRAEKARLDAERRIGDKPPSLRDKHNRD